MAGLGGAIGGFLRAVVECPMEVMKTRKQVDSFWTVRSLYTGLPITAARNSTVIGLFWMFFEVSKNFRVQVSPNRQVASFLGGAGCSTLAWVSIFPLDVVKSRVQGMRSNSALSPSTVQVVRTLWLEAGLRGFYRGLAPGLCRSVVANGGGMVLYDWVYDKLNMGTK